MDYKKWLLDNYTFFEDIVEFEYVCFKKMQLKFNIVKKHFF